jgi:uncharacterized membrane protein
MPTMIVLFACLLFVVLASGGAFVVYLVYNPATTPADLWIPSMQHAIRVMLPLAVVLNLGLLFTIICAVLSRRDRQRFYFLLAASICILGAILVTVIGNWPINDQIKTWSATAPPPTWTQLRDEWWRFHLARTLMLIAGLSCVVVAALVRENPGMRNVPAT